MTQFASGEIGIRTAQNVTRAQRSPPISWLSISM